eukprot:SAG31_NODE_20516_length_572_cov_0.951374_2_plen_105_part_01
MIRQRAIYWPGIDRIFCVCLQQALHSFDFNCTCLGELGDLHDVWHCRCWLLRIASHGAREWRGQAVPAAVQVNSLVERWNHTAGTSLGSTRSISQTAEQENRALI